MSLDAAISVLTRAVELDQAQSYSESLVCYQEGLGLLMNVLKSTADEVASKHIREKMDSYIQRAEKLKALVKQQKEAGKFHEKIRIKDGAVGYEYSKVFAVYLEGRVTEITVEDPYIRSHHQILNFLRFCEMLVKKDTVKLIRLVTGRDEGSEKQEQQLHKLNKLKASLRNFNVDLQFSFSDTLHDREIRFNNGWVIKIGRGLDYFKAPDGNFCIGHFDYSFRPCHETTIDVFQRK